MTTLIGSVTFGIWKICTSSALFGKKNDCKDLPCGEQTNAYIDCNKIHDGRILFVCTCIITIISALSCFLVALTNEKSNRRLLITSLVKILATISFLMGILTISIITYHTGNVQDYVHLSLDLCAYLGTIGIVIHLIGLIIALLIK